VQASTCLAQTLGQNSPRKDPVRLRGKRRQQRELPRRQRQVGRPQGGLVRSKNTQVAPFAVGAYITGAYFFTSSTSFANPAVTLARTLSDTFAGIAPSSVPGFGVAQVLGAIIACGVIRVRWLAVEAVAQDVVVPHEALDGQRATALQR
jgi:hypothetical protein